MKNKGLISIIVICAILIIPSWGYCQTESIVDVAIRNHDDVIKISNTGIDIAQVHKYYVSLVVRDREIEQLKKAGYTIQKTCATSNDLKKRFSGKTAADAGKYHTYDETMALLKEWAKKYPNLVKFETIGKTFEKRDVPVVRITAAPAGKLVPKFCVMGMHHSREWISVEVPLQFGQLLIDKYGKDDHITKLLKEREVWLVPIVNPDGYIWSQTQYSYWRKNRNDNDGSRYKGVDPNRNYGYEWGNVGASNYPSSDTYHGKGPFSEPCTQNIKRLAEREKFTADISYHSSGQLILYPWSYTGSYTCPDDKLFSKLAKDMAALNKYRPQQSADLYPSMGDTDDFMYGVMGSLSFTFELARQFIPSESDIDSICAKNNKAMLYLLEKIGEVHASNNPLFASKLKVQTSRLTYYNGVAKELESKSTEKSDLDSINNQVNETRKKIVEILDPVSDLQGNNFREFVSIYSNTSELNKEAFIPVLEDLRSAYLVKSNNEQIQRIMKLRFEIIDRLLK